MARSLRLLALSFACCLALAAAPARAAQPQTEAAVEAAFIYNFSKFVDWPDESFHAPQEAIRLCLLGAGQALRDELAAIDGKPAHSRPIRIVPLRRAGEAKSCHMLVVGSEAEQQLPTVLATVRQDGLLTVSDIDGFVDAGGMIGLILVSDRMRFEINLEAARQARLRLSSELLKLARRVRQGN